MTKRLQQRIDRLEAALLAGPGDGIPAPLFKEAVSLRLRLVSAPEEEQAEILDQIGRQDLSAYSLDPGFARKQLLLLEKAKATMALFVDYDTEQAGLPTGSSTEGSGTLLL